MTCKTEPAAPTARVRRMSRREMDWFAMLNVALSGFVEEVFRSAPGERHDGERGILVRIGDERSAVGDKKIFRSEERRVGKVCKSWWWRFHIKKKNIESILALNCSIIYST